MFLDEKFLWPAVVATAFVVAIIALAIIAFIIALAKRSKSFKKTENKYDENFDPSEYFNTNSEEALVKEDYGEVYEIFGMNNIISVECEMSRVTIEVNDIDLVKIQELQKKGADGILLVGNKIKCNFKEEAQEIAEYLKGSINND